VIECLRSRPVHDGEPHDCTTRSLTHSRPSRRP
jgi:hypothetical protein